MGKIDPQNNRFYLSRKLIAVVAFFIITASGLVVLTNFSINMITASRDYTALLSKWSQYHYRVSIAAERYGRTGKPSAYQKYVELQKEKQKLYLPIDELFNPEIDTKVIFESLRQTGVYPNVISTLILAFNRFNNLSSVRELHRRWLNLHELDIRQQKLVDELHKVWGAGEPDRAQVNRLLSDIRELNRSWNNRNEELMSKVGQASLGINRFGLWISVILGIILVLIGVVVSTRANKSVGRWERSLHEKEVLLAEIHHRVKNNLAVISSLLELESVQNRNPEQALQESRNRIQSMAMIHEILYQSDSFSEIRLDEYIKELSGYIYTTYIGSEKQIDFKTNLEEVTLNINQAVPAGLILNELLTNAIEHGFESSGKGSFIVALEETGGQVRLSVCDNGKGLPEGFDYETSETTGFAIIKALVSQLEADLAIRNSQGVGVVLQFRKTNAPGSRNGFL